MGDLTYSKKLVKASLKSYMELTAKGNVNLAEGGVRCLFTLFLKFLYSGCSGIWDLTDQEETVLTRASQLKIVRDSK